MIPLKLELRNFMAYRECDPIDMNGLHTVVLSGENGAGKSALLDAMTWALWGRARARRDDELIAQNESEMRVAFTFSEGRNTFQVVRSRKVGKATAKRAVATSSGSLDFFVSEAGSWRSLSEPKQSDTENKIQSTLNLSYETFVNSAFLRQGRADEFAVKTPAERKALLGEILDLDIWQQYDQRAKARAEAVERDELLRQSELERNEAELARLPEFEAALAQAHATQVGAQEQFQALEQQAAEFGRIRASLGAVQARLRQQQDQATAMERERAGMQREREQHVQLLRDYETALTDRDAIETGYAQLVEAQALNDALGRKMASMVDLDARRNAAERAIAEARHALQSRRDGLKERLEAARRIAQDISLEDAAQQAAQALARAAEQQQERDGLQREQAAAREQTGMLRAQNEQLKRDMLVIKARIDALKSAGAICETCGRALDEETRERLLGELQAEGTRLGDGFRGNNATSEQLAAAQRSADQRLRAIDTELANLPRLQRELATIDEKLRLAREAAAMLPGLEGEHDSLEAQLRERRFAPAAHAELERTLSELEALGYDRAAHNRVRDDELPRLHAFATRKAQLDRAEMGVLAGQRALEALDGRERVLSESLSTITAAIAAGAAEAEQMQRSLAGETHLAANMQRARNELFAAQRKLGEAEQRIGAVRSLEAICERQRRELAGFRKQRSMLKELREAFGRNGVPAMIIEVALPELEASANDLLARISNGRMRVKFETQRQTRSNEISETLEIRISDELGERTYEMFSGGEAFRVNFAIRIALSKLLAHRQGARLQTLFIDEGFGTQDVQGRERLIEAIRAIEQDFERIFVITHIDELKEAFPARIDIIKTAKGSITRIA